MELPVDNKIPFISIEIIENATKLETQVYTKLTLDYSYILKATWINTIKTMINRAYALSSTTEAFKTECTKLRTIFSCLDYPMSLIDSAINNFLFQNSSANKAVRNNDDSSTVRISLFLKIKWPLIRFGSSYAILAIWLALLCSQFSWVRNWGKILNPKKSSCQLWISSVLFTIFHVICAMRHISHNSR